MILSSVVLLSVQRLKIVDILARDVIIPSLIFVKLCHGYKGGPSKKFQYLLNGLVKDLNIDFPPDVLSCLIHYQWWFWS